ncbi:aldo/keto reductase [Leifsonia naganoensis]|uniref:Aryl-alcohol dehydrogenase-like predicted oxidoreductase n=1 Tax=Leifsonia naganoensis TaxID=150025 RepID=A0A853DLJ6_9MICO|nr:aldo/keto reductase [Leifsonia naganoensis]NYK09127.1 aryl-alcohol dehydrogenase-like predicted oxidoreductase [Leifsonia naganoensis]
MATPLPTRPLGTTSMDISRIGFGSLAMGGAQWVSGRGEQTDDDSVASARAAIEAGINWIDTAPVYGRGLAEELVGRVVRDFPAADRPLIFTKAGLAWDDDDPRGEPTRTGSPDRIRREVDDSLRRLGVERIDLYQMHWPPLDDYRVEDYWPVFAELRDQGKVRAIGLSNHTVEELAAAERITHVDSMQPPFSALNRDAAADVIPASRAQGTAVLAYAPMESGLLTGTFTPERAGSLSETDWRKSDPAFSGEGLRRNLMVVDALSAVAAARGVTTSAIAVAWTLSFDGLTGAIVGARTPGQIADWIDAASLELSADELDTIARAIEASGAGTGPARPAPLS